jgi:hypothetical protein
VPYVIIGGQIIVDWVIKIIAETWQVFLEAAPYVVVGLLAAALIHTLFPKEKIEKVLGKPGFGSILKAALFGIPLPLCSCGVLPTALSLKDRGASRGATISFLVSTPETGLDSIAVTYALINPAMAILRPVAAFLSAVLAGIGVERFGGAESNAGKVESCGCHTCGDESCHDDHSWKTRLRASVDYILNDFFPDIANWILLGLIISGIVAALVPQDFLASIPGPAQIIVAVIAGVPIYICASASTPIAAVLMAKGVSPGAALVFLLVGPATNMASLMVIGRRLGKRTAVVYLGSLVAAALVIAFSVEAFMGGWNWIPKIADPSLHEHFTWFNWIGAAVLALGFLHVWRRQAIRRFRTKAATQTGHSHIEASQHKTTV